MCFSSLKSSDILYSKYSNDSWLLIQIFFNASNEELLQVKGTTGKVDGDLVVTSLTFHSNKRVFGPFGSVRDTEFESSPSGKVNGFYGKAGVCLDQIGFITQFSSSKLADEVVAQGPWGGPKGDAFYGGRGEILDIIVCYSKAQIVSLQLTYEHNGRSFKGERHGADGGEMIKVQKLSLFVLYFPENTFCFITTRDNIGLAFFKTSGLNS